MKKYLGLTAAALITVSGSQAALVSLTNADFEAGVGNFPDGFDADPDIPGWMDLTITDAGVEAAGAWWGTFDGHSAFLAVGNGAYLLSGYTIQDGDEFTVGAAAKTWDATSELTATVFYDDPANVIGTYTIGVDNTWTLYSSTPIAATPASIGGTLGISIENSASSGFLNFDDVSIDVVPEPSVALLGGVGILGLLRRRRSF